MVLVNTYYENCPYRGKSGKDEKRGNYLSISHGYGSHGGPNVHGNVVQYHLTSKSHSKEYSWKAQGDLIASNIWSHIYKFGDSINKFFADQFVELKCIAIGEDEHPRNVHSMHISKNSKIKPHLDVTDKEASIITWFHQGDMKRGNFAVYQLWYKFSTSNGPSLFIRSGNLVHGALQFETSGVELHSNFKLGVALVNKKQICTRLVNQKVAEEPLTFSKDYWSSITPEYDGDF